MWEFLDWLAQDVMTTDVVTLRPQATLGDAEALFEAHGVNALPVIDPNGHLLGVVTKLDLLKAFRFDGTEMAPNYELVMRRPVREVMTTELTTANPRTPLTRVLDKLVRERVKSLPVINGRTVVGIVSREDVLQGLRWSVDGYPRPSLSASGS